MSEPTLTSYTEERSETGDIEQVQLAYAFDPLDQMLITLVGDGDRLRFDRANARRDTLFRPAWIPPLRAARSELEERGHDVDWGGLFADEVGAASADSTGTTDDTDSDQDDDGERWCGHCGKHCVSEHGLRIHHASAHDGEPIVLEHEPAAAELVDDDHTEADGDDLEGEDENENPEDESDDEGDEQDLWDSPEDPLAANDLDPDAVIDAVDGARKILDVERELNVDREVALDVVEYLGLLEDLRTGTNEISPTRARTAVQEVTAGD